MECPETLGMNITLVWARRFPPAQAARRDHSSAFCIQAENGSPSQARSCSQPSSLAVPWGFSPHPSLVLNFLLEFLQRIQSLELSSSWSPPRHPNCSPVEMPSFPEDGRMAGLFFVVIRFTCWKKHKPLYFEFSPWVLLPWHRGSYKQRMISSSGWTSWEPGRSICLLLGYLGISSFWGDSLVNLSNLCS